jgi:hypothetical protein
LHVWEVTHKKQNVFDPVTKRLKNEDVLEIAENHTFPFDGTITASAIWETKLFYSTLESPLMVYDL